MHARFSSWFYAADIYEKQRVADIGVIFSKDNYNLNGNIYYCILKRKDYWYYVKLWKNKSCLCVFYSKVLSLSS